MSLHLTSPMQVDATVQLPASKSISNRALILNALSKSTLSVENLSDCDDTRVMVEAFASSSSHIDILAAGTAMRFLTAYLAQQPGTWHITGTARMQQRPIALLVDALRQLGAHITYEAKEGFPPLCIEGGELTGGELALRGDLSSQYISALLMVAPYTQGGLQLRLTSPAISRPYIQMTLQLMARYGVSATWEGDLICVPRGCYTPIPFRVESDWSAASYWYEMAALSSAGEITLMGLEQASLQGDARIAQLFEPLGVSTSFTPEGVKLSRQGAHTSHYEIDLTDQPDLAQTLVVTCAMLSIPFVITGLQSLKIKETDRIVALQNELKKLGYVIVSRNDNTLLWSGERCSPCFEGGIDTYDDHRMAMAFAPVALAMDGVVINHPEVVSKSYPSYWAHLAEAGFDLKEI